MMTMRIHVTSLAVDHDEHEYSVTSLLSIVFICYLPTLLSCGGYSIDQQ